MKTSSYYGTNTCFRMFNSLAVFCLSYVLFLFQETKISTSSCFGFCFMAARLSANIFLRASSRAFAAAFIFSVRSGEDSGVSLALGAFLRDPGVPLGVLPLLRDMLPDFGLELIELPRD